MITQRQTAASLLAANPRVNRLPADEWEEGARRATAHANARHESRPSERLAARRPELAASGSRGAL